MDASLSLFASRLSCIVCAYNEAARIGPVLQIAAHHPLIGEVIVVDDGSLDATSEVVRQFANVELVRNEVNLGKSRSLARGIERARFGRLMLLDADLSGLRPSHIDALADPVMQGAADAAISMRGDSFYRALGVDFVSGERVLPRALFAEALDELAGVSPWGAEIFINEKLIESGLRVAIVDWKDVAHVPKTKKTNPWRGLMSEFGMAREIVRELGPQGIVRQNLALRTRPRRQRAAA